MNPELHINVTIVTVTFNASDFIERYFEAAERVLDSFPNLSLVVVDNASSDDTVSKLSGCMSQADISDRCKLVVSEENIGFGRGCNLGAKNAEGFCPEAIWFLNPDTVVSLESPIELLKQMVSDGCDFVGSALADENGQIRSGAFRFPTPITVFLSTSLLGFLARALPHRASTIEIKDRAVTADWLTGASFLVKKSAFDALGGFDAKYFLYFEEVDLFFRAKINDMKVVSTPKSTVYHQSGASTGINARKNSVKQPRRPAFWFESRRYFYLKNFGAFTFLATDIAFVSGMLIRKMKNFIQRKPDVEPEYLIRDIFAYSVFGKGTKIN